MRRKDLESDWNNRSSGYTIRTGVVGARPAMSAATREDLGERSEGRTARHSVDTASSLRAAAHPQNQDQVPSEAE